MYKTKAYVKSPRGLHARPSAAIVKVAQKFKSIIFLRSDKTNKVANGKHVLEILTLAALKKECIEITAEGIDEVSAGNAVAKVINDFFIPEEE